MQLHDFIEKARAKGLSDEHIQSRLVAHGWDPKVVSLALQDDDDLPVPLPPNSNDDTNQKTPDSPVASAAKAKPSINPAYSLEYLIMLLSLWFAAVGLGGILHNVVDFFWGQGGGDMFSPFFAACLIVGGPIYLALFVLTKKEEQRDETVLASNARKLMIPLTIVIAFLIGVGYLIGYIINLLTYKQSYDYPWSNFLQMLITLLIAGGICLQYWRELRRSRSIK